MKNKTFLEKTGDALDHMGKRFLICLGIAAVGFLLLLIPFTMVIGAPLAFFGVFGMLSVIPKKKTYLVGTITVTSPDGDEIPCTIVKQKHYAYMPLVPIVCPFYYLSFKTQYSLVKYVSATNPPKPLRIHNALVDAGLFTTEKLTHAEYKALVENGASSELSCKLKADAKNARSLYLSDIEHFVSTGLMEEIYHTDGYSVAKLCGDGLGLFYYSPGAAGQNGIIITEELFGKIKNDDSFFFSALTKEPTYLRFTIELTDKALERFLNAPELRETVNHQKAREVRAEMDKEKKPLTRELIMTDLKFSLITAKLLWGIFWTFWFIFCVPIGFLAGIPGIIIFTVLGGAFTGFFSFGYLKEHIENKKKLESGTFTVTRVPCTDVEVETDSEGDEYFKHKFANGATIGNSIQLCVAGDYYYFVYVKDDKGYSKYYPALEYAPAPDITVTDHSPITNE